VWPRGKGWGSAGNLGCNTDRYDDDDGAGEALVANTLSLPQMLRNSSTWEGLGSLSLSLFVPAVASDDMVIAGYLLFKWKQLHRPAVTEKQLATCRYSEISHRAYKTSDRILSAVQLSRR
jgi:hypothetical protein